MVEKVYPQRALRAQEILSAAALELAEFGIAAFRPRKVAERLGVSNGLIHYHFATKNKLVSAAFACEAQRQLDELTFVEREEDQPTNRLLRALRIYGPDGTAFACRLWIDGGCCMFR